MKIVNKYFFCKTKFQGWFDMFLSRKKHTNIFETIFFWLNTNTFWLTIKVKIWQLNMLLDKKCKNKQNKKHFHWYFPMQIYFSFSSLTELYGSILLKFGLPLTLVQCNETNREKLMKKNLYLIIKSFFC